MVSAKWIYPLDLLPERAVDEADLVEGGAERRHPVLTGERGDLPLRHDRNVKNVRFGIGLHG